MYNQFTSLSRDRVVFQFEDSEVVGANLLDWHRPGRNTGMKIKKINGIGHKLS